MEIRKIRYEVWNDWKKTIPGHSAYKLAVYMGWTYNPKFEVRVKRAIAKIARKELMLEVHSALSGIDNDRNDILESASDNRSDRAYLNSANFTIKDPAKERAEHRKNQTVKMVIRNEFPDTDAANE